MKRSVEGESGRDAHILASAPSLEAAPQRSAGTPNGTGAPQSQRHRGQAWFAGPLPIWGNNALQKGPGLYGPRGKPPADLWFKGCLKTAVYCGGSSRLSTQFNPANQF